MAINLYVHPTTPNPVAGDWQKLVDLVTYSFQNVNSPTQVDYVGNVIPQGSTFQVGGVIYYGNSDTAITGTGDYVKLTITGTTLVPTYVSVLTGVNWDKIYNGYYHTDGSLYVFDEVKAILAGALSGSNSRFMEMFNAFSDQSLKTTANVEFANLVASALSVANDAIFAGVSKQVAVASSTLISTKYPISGVNITDVAFTTYGTLVNRLQGTIRLDFKMAIINTSDIVYGRVLKNSVVAGGPWSNGTVTPTTYSVDLGVVPGDIIEFQFYLGGSRIAAGGVSDLNLKGTYSQGSYLLDDDMPIV